MLTVLGLVAGGLGVALAPQSAEQLGRSGVAYRRLRDAGPPVELGAFWSVDDGSATLRNFLALVPAT